MTSNANMSIAKWHRSSRKFVGQITAMGPIIAYILSFVTIMAGVVIYSWQVFDRSQWYMWAVSAVIGALLSILVERLTLTQAAKVRHVKEQKDAIDDAYDKVEDHTEEVTRNHKRELDKASKGYNTALLLMLLGVLVSTAAGTLFWHFVLQHLPNWQAWAFSTAFSMIVSFTLVSSELHKRLDAKVVSESIVADNFVGLAAREDSRNRIIGKFAEQHDEALERALDADTMKQIADATALQTVDSVFNGQGAIPSNVSRERELMIAQQAAERERTRTQMRAINAAKTGEKNSDKVRSTARLGGEDVVFDSPFQTGTR